MRNYIRLTIEMIADGNAVGATQVVTDALVHLGAGEIDVKAEVLGPVQVNGNGYAVPWPKAGKAVKMTDAKTGRRRTGRIYY